MNTNHIDQSEEAPRILARIVATEMTEEEMDRIAGGSMSFSGARATTVDDSGLSVL